MYYIDKNGDLCKIEGQFFFDAEAGIYNLLGENGRRAAFSIFEIYERVDVPVEVFILRKMLKMQRIEAIKFLRNISGCSLKTARDFVEEFHTCL